MTNFDAFSGVWTALITPFSEDGEIDYQAFDKLIEMQINGGVRGILFLGTTGETPTLTKEEKIEIVKRGIEKIKGRCLVMVGSGTYSTSESINVTKMFDEIPGIDVFMAVNPYYNKPTQEGMYRHFKAIGKSTTKPFIIYNIHCRTGVNLETKTLLRISKDCKNLIGVKEASGDIEQMQEVIDTLGEDFVVFSGDDNMTYSLMKIGGRGIVSVASNYIPKSINKMVEAALQNDFKRAENINNDLSDFFTGQFIQTNPLPIKVALAEQGLIKETYRLPLCEMDTEPRKDWINILKKYKGKN